MTLIFSSVVGLDAAGKTTILYKLKLGEIVTTIPTIGKKISEPKMDRSLAYTTICKTWALSAPGRLSLKASLQ